MNFIKKFLNQKDREEETQSKGSTNTFSLIEKFLDEEEKEGGTTMATVKDMEKLLAQVVKDNGLEGAIIADVEGLPLASYLPSGFDEDEVAATSAAILSISDSKLGDSGKGNVIQVSIEAEKGYLVITPVKGEYVISVLAPKETKLGIILSAVRSIEKKL